MLAPKRAKRGRIEELHKQHDYELHRMESARVAVINQARSFGEYARKAAIDAALTNFRLLQLLLLFLLLLLLSRSHPPADSCCAHDFYAVLSPYRAPCTLRYCPLALPRSMHPSVLPSLLPSLCVCRRLVHIYISIFVMLSVRSPHLT